MRERSDEGQASEGIPGEPLHVPIDRRELYAPIWILVAVLMLVGGILLWRALGGGDEDPEEAATFACALVWLGVVGAAAVALALRGIRLTARTVFTSEGVWRPGWLGGGRFWRWSEVERADLVRGGHGAITHLRLRSGGRRTRIRLNAFRSPRKVVGLARRRLRERMEGEPPAEDPE